jgi:hypothetical protein
MVLFGNKSPPFWFTKKPKDGTIKCTKKEIIMPLIDQRQDKRRHLIYYLSAIDARTKTLVGYVYDITTKGMLLLCSEPVEAGSVIDFDIVLPHGLSVTQSFSVKAECRWSKPDVNPENYLSGFSFTHIDRPAAVTINALIARFGFQD